ncbi:MAG: prepilin-type N-terminal cleavage/methylation domain-containing protein [Betaproteobacteria bacterium]|nr:prepilin-type N-terminal cleavage/methylation domain-containing protein [Betaproteobacteria bacterium]
MARISATGTRRGEPGRATGTRGFTLIEILVVVAVAGIVLAVAAVNLFPGDEEVARRETSLLALDIEGARDDAWFGGRPTAVSLADGRMQVLRLAPDRSWSAVPGRERRLPDTMQVDTLAIDGRVVDAREVLIFLPDGLGVPFRVALTVRGLPKAIEGDSAGAVRAIAK